MLWEEKGVSYESFKTNIWAQKIGQKTIPLRWFGCTLTIIFRASTLQIMIARWIANFRVETSS